MNTFNEEEKWSSHFSYSLRLETGRSLKRDFVASFHSEGLRWFVAVLDVVCRLSFLSMSRIF